MRPFSFQWIFILAALAAAGGCFWYGMAIVMPDLIYGKIALGLVPIFLLIALLLAIREFGWANSQKGRRPQEPAAAQPELESLRDRMLMNGPPTLGIITSADGARIVSAQVQLNMTNGAPRALSYTVHRFRGEIEGAAMPDDVDAPNYGGELLSGEPRTYNGGRAAVDIGAGPFRGKVEWNISYGVPGNEPFVFARRAAFSGLYNPQTRRGEQIQWTWHPLSEAPAL